MIATAGAAGFGGGAGGSAASGGAGGSAFGGAVFVRQGGSLRIVNGSISGSSVTAGTGGPSAANGSTEGTAVYLHTGTTLTYEVASGTSTVANAIGGAGSLSKAGAGTLRLQVANTYTGGTTQSGGTLQVDDVAGLGTGTLTQSSGAVLAVNTSGTIGNAMSLYQVNFLQGATLSGSLTLNNTTFDVANGQSSVLSGVLSGTGGITKNGAGTLAVGGASTYTGDTVVNQGNLVLGAGATLASSTDVNVAAADGAAVFDISGISGAGLTVGSIASGANGTIALAGKTLTAGGNNNDTTAAGAITGAGGSLVKAGSGRLTLAGANTYTGGTTLSGGRIRLDNASALGTGTLTQTAGTVLEVNTAGTIANAMNLVRANFLETATLSGNLTVSSSTFEVASAEIATLSGVVAGTGGVTKSGAGNLALTAANTFTGGITIREGSLAVSGGGSVAAGTSVEVTAADGDARFDISGIAGAGLTVGSVASGIDGTIVLGAKALTTGGDNTSTTLAGTITGAGGSLIKEGSGTLTLAGENSFTGGTSLTAGTIRIEDVSALGAGTFTQSAGTILILDTSGTIANSMSLYQVNFLQSATLSGNLTLNNATFDVAAGKSATLSGVLSGAGGITKNGAGTLTVTGANTFTGVVEVNGGKLITTGTSALGLGDVTFADGVVQLQSRLNLGGALTWSNAATVAIDSVEAGQYVDVAGNLNSTPGTKTFDVTQSALSENQSFPLLKSANLGADFTTNNFSVIIDPAFRYALQIDGNTLSIRLTSTDYSVYAQTPNQQQVATALSLFSDSSSGDRVAVTTVLNDLDLSAYPAAFVQNMPAIYSSMPTLAFNTANAVNTKLFERLWLTRVGAADPGLSGGATDTSSALAPPASTRDPLGLEPDQNWSTFLDGNGIFATANSGGAMDNYRSQSGGMTAGAVYKFMEGFDAGLYVGYQYLNSGYGGDSQLQDNAARFGLLGSWAWPGVDPSEETVWLNGLVGGAWHNYDVDRQIVFGTIDRTAGSTPGAGEFDLAAGAGYDLKEGNFTFGPAASVQYTYLGVQSFDESGADSLDLAVNSFNSSSCLFTLGGQAAYRWEVSEGLVITPMVSASWQHEFLQDAYTIGSAFDTAGPSSPFNYTTSAPERNFFYGGAGVSFAIDSRWQVIALWNCAAGNADLLSQNVYLSLNAKF